MSGSPRPRASAAATRARFGWAATAIPSRANSSAHRDPRIPEAGRSLADPRPLTLREAGIARRGPGEVRHVRAQPYPASTTAAVIPALRSAPATSERGVSCGTPTLKFPRQNVSVQLDSPRSRAGHSIRSLCCRGCREVPPQPRRACRAASHLHLRCRAPGRPNRKWRARRRERNRRSITRGSPASGREPTERPSASGGHGRHSRLGLGDSLGARWRRRRDDKERLATHHPHVREGLGNEENRPSYAAPHAEVAAQPMGTSGRRSARRRRARRREALARPRGLGRDREVRRTCIAKSAGAAHAPLHDSTSPG